MKITSELDLTNFEFWSGAKEHNFNKLELIELEFILSDIYGGEISETKLNDIFWFEEEFLCELLGVNFEKYLNR